MRTITLADNSVHTVSWFGESGGFLSFELTDSSDVAAIANDFSDHEKTKIIIGRITSNDEEDYAPIEYHDFSDLNLIQKDIYTNNVLVTMHKVF